MAAGEQPPRDSFDPNKTESMIWLGRGRFVSPKVAEKYDLDVPEYEGIDQVVELNTEAQKL